MPDRVGHDECQCRDSGRVRSVQSVENVESAEGAYKGYLYRFSYLPWDM